MREINDVGRLNLDSEITRRTHPRLPEQAAVEQEREYFSRDQIISVPGEGGVIDGGWRFMGVSDNYVGSKEKSAGRYVQADKAVDGKLMWKEIPFDVAVKLNPKKQIC